MTIRVALTVNNVRGYKPRGVVRGTRAIAEALLKDRRFEFYVIALLSFERVDVVAEHWRLGDYLAYVPMDLADLKRARVDSSDWKTRLLDFAARRSTWVLAPAAARWGMRVSRTLGLYDLARAVYRGVRNRTGLGVDEPELARAELQATPLGPVSLNLFDVVLSFEAFEDLWFWPTETLRCKTLLVAHDTIPLRIHEGSGASAYRFFCTMGTAVLRADRIACNSMATQHDVNSFYPGTVGKTFVALHGHRREAFAAARSARPPGEHARVLMIGDVDRRKNLQAVLRAMPLVSAQHPSRAIELIIVGNQARRNEFRHTEHAAAKHVTVRWVGFAPDQVAADMVASSDVIVMPSLWEGFGVPVLEAMSAGVPVVCSSLASFPEVGGAHALYCDPYDVASIASAIVEGLSMTGAARKAHVDAAASWAAAFTWQRTANALAESMLDLAAVKPREAVTTPPGFASDQSATVANAGAA